MAIHDIMKTSLDGILLIKPKVFEDHRGQFVEIYNEEIYCEKGINIKFVQDDISISSKHVLRGIHHDPQTWKLVSCLYGRIYLIIVNCNEGSSLFGKWQQFTISDTNRYQVLVTPDYGVAHMALTEKVIFHYKQTTYYTPSCQRTFKWNDPRFNIWWPIKNPVLSQRDEIGHYV